MADTTTSALNWATVENGKVKTTTSKKAMSPTTEPWDMISSLHYFVRKCSTRATRTYQQYRICGTACNVLTVRGNAWHAGYTEK